jgi:hypothetical protein
MSKFIPSTNGDYLNCDRIDCVFLENNVIFIKQGEFRWVLANNFKTNGEAQLWLDKFMTKYDLALGVVKEN